MDRRRFLSTVGAASVGAASTPLFSGPAPAQSAPDRSAQAPRVDDRLLDTLTRVNDLQVPATLSSYQRQIDSLSNPRTIAQSALRLVVAFVNPRGRNHHDPVLLAPVGTLLDALASQQNPSGLYDLGNLDSPPDTAFVISDLGMSHDLLRADNQPNTAPIREKYAAIMKKAANALVSGGVHTPNHRWEICKALAHIHHIWPSRSVLARIDEWLGEGIDQDDEGEYSERSPNYASEVTNRSLVIVARLADRLDLLDHVARNLDMTLYRLEPNGEVETVQSRRQDQTGVQDVWKYLMHFRELAVRSKDGRFAAVAEQILDRVAADPASFAGGGYSVGEFLAEALAYPDLAVVLPPSANLPTDYERFYRGSQLVRIRRDNMTASIFGGTDWHNERQDAEGRQTSIREIASGLSTNPTFFKFRKGAAILQSVRLSPVFFGTGHFRSKGVASEQGGWRLSDSVSVPYHQPLPGRYRRRNGDYALASEGRFYSRMDFPHRPKQHCVLNTVVTIREAGRGGFDFAFDVDGQPTSVTIELCFRVGGTLTGVVPAPGDGNFQLVEGEGRYSVGDDSITFGPGNGSGLRQPVRMDAGEKYSYLGGSLVPSGQRVYITGNVPFRYTLRLR
jgi:hypothetical protein